MPANDALVLVFSRNSFYKRLYYLALAVFALSLGILIFLIVIIYYLLQNPVHPVYFATDNVGRLIQIVPVNTPNMTTEEVTNWAIEAVEAINSYDYINYRAQLQSAQKYFTPYGWGKYMTALTASNNLLGLTNRKQIQMAQVIDRPKILAQGILAGSYAWKYQMQVLITYSEPPYDNKSKFSNAWVAEVIVQRQPVLQGYKGLGVVQLVQEFATITNKPQEISGEATG
jgi:intracellular multiplication protein IcmL